MVTKKKKVPAKKTVVTKKVVTPAKPTPAVVIKPVVVKPNVKTVALPSKEDVKPGRKAVKVSVKVDTDALTKLTRFLTNKK